MLMAPLWCDKGAATGAVLMAPLWCDKDAVTVSEQLWLLVNLLQTPVFQPSMMHSGFISITVAAYTHTHTNFNLIIINGGCWHFYHFHQCNALYSLWDKPLQFLLQGPCVFCISKFQEKPCPVENVRGYAINIISVHMPAQHIWASPGHRQETKCSQAEKVRG